MSTPINLDLDFQDYAPTKQTSLTDADQEAKKRRQSTSAIRVPSTSKSVTSSHQIVTGSQRSGNEVIITPQGISAKSDEALRQLSWASGGTVQKQAAHKPGFGWGLGYFSKYFDITTRDVLERIIWSVIPIQKKVAQVEGLDEDELLAPLAWRDGQELSNNGDVKITAAEKSCSYIERFIQSRPDLYGPFWISTTLVFSVTIFSNVVSFAKHKFNEESKIDYGPFNNASSNTMSSQITAQAEDWHYSMDELNTISAIVTLYVTFLPALIWSLFWFRGCSKCYTFGETVCAYGYSLSIYVPLAALLTVQFTPFRYVSVALASLAPGSVLLSSFIPVARSDPSQASSHIILAFIPLCHLGLGYIMHRIMLQ